MSNSWSPARNASGGRREIFAAFVCDDRAGDLMRATCVELGWPIERIHKGGLRNAVQTLSVSASPTILFVDLSDSTDPLHDINALAEVCEPGTIVITGGQVNDVRLYRDLLASGIQDYLLKPFTTEQLRDALAHAQAILAAPRQEQHDEQDHAHIAVIGARGGCGSSSLAAALAWTLSEEEGRPTALLDLDIHFGTAALALDLEPGRGLKDAIENPSRIDGLFLERAMIKVSEKLSVLSAEATIDEPLIPDGTAFRLLQEEVKNSFDYMVTDTPRDLAIYNPDLLSNAHVIVLVADLTLAAARDVFRLLSLLRAIAPQTHILVALNRVQSGGIGEINRKEFESSIERKVDFVLPEDTKIARRSTKTGKAFTDAGKGSRLADIVGEMATHIARLTASDANVIPLHVPKAGKTSLLNKLAELGTRLNVNRKTGSAAQ